MTNINVKVSIDDLVLSTAMKNLINYTIRGAETAKKAFPHTIITGGPGTGKTSLATAIADHFKEEDCNNVMMFNAATLEKNANSLIKFIMDRSLWNKHNIIIILDEIHSLNKQVCERLYGIFDYNELYFPNGKLPVKNLTIIGCTTDPQKVPAPLMDRLTFKLRLGNYTNDDLVDIMSHRLSGINYTNEALSLIANISRGVPRIALQNLTNMNNYAIAMNLVAMDRTQVIESLALMGMDEHGLTDEDKTVIQIIFENQPASLTLITSMLNMDPLIYQENVEIPLISKGYLAKTPKGRVTTQKSIDMLYSV